MQRPTRRSARAGFPEPDDFEGLPVRQWRQEWVSVAPSAQQETTQQGDRWAAELPFGMPKEAHLLPAHTQELLRAARSGRLYKRAAPADEEEQDAEVDVVIKGEKKDWEPPNDGYMVKVWKQVPRNAENPTISHLAKRHKNTVTLSSRALATQATGPTVVRATVRRIDAAGNPYEQTVTLNDGQQVDGEIISTTVVPAPQAAQGELPFQQPTPTRRRPPPPKRKAKGVGRGRKKGKLPIPLPATRSQATTADGEPPVKPEAAGPDGIKTEDPEGSVNQDSEMADMSVIPSEDEDGDGGEGDEDEEGEEEAGDDAAGETPNVEEANADTRDQEAEDLDMAEAVQPSSVEEPDEPRPVPEEVEEVTIPKVRFQPPSLSNLGPQHVAMHLGSSRIEGSPLKNVMVLSPTEPSPMMSPQAATASFSASSYLDAQSRTMSTDLGSGGAVSQAYAAETTVQGILPPLRASRAPGQVHSQNGAAAPLLAQVPRPPTFIKEEAADSPPMTAPEQPSRGVAAPESSAPATTGPPQPPAEAAPSPATQPKSEPTETTTREASLQPPASPALLPTVTQDEDDGLNLLGSLERELDRQEEGMSNGSRSGSGSDKKGGITTPDMATTATATAAAMATTTTTTATATATTTSAEGEDGPGESSSAPKSESEVAIKEEVFTPTPAAATTPAAGPAGSS